MNPSTAFATVLADELVRCGLRDAVLAPGSRSAPVAMALHAAAARPGSSLRLHVRIDERSASFLALGLAKASGRPVAVVCTSGTATAHIHAAVIEADEACVPLLVLTADRPPELRGTGSNQTIDQLRLYGSAVRWFAEAGVPERRDGQVAYWRSLACRAWLTSAGTGNSAAGPVQVNLPLRDPLVPGLADAADDDGPEWCEPLDGRAGGSPWTQAAGLAGTAKTDTGVPVLDLDWTQRGIVVAGDSASQPDGLARLAATAGWPLLAEPSSGARRGSSALTAYQYLLDSAEFTRGHQPDVIVSAGRPGLTRGQLALLRRSAPRHVTLLQAPGRWSDPARTATHVAGSIRLRGAPADPSSDWLRAWQAADTAAAEAACSELDADGTLSEPLTARTVAAGLPDGALLWVSSSLPARDLDRQMAPRAGLTVLASRGASGIDGMVSSAAGAALAHQAAGGGPAAALLGDLALLHDAPGLFAGPLEERPDLCLIVVNNDGGGIFATLEQAAFPDSFERLFGTPHGADLSALAAAAGIPYARLTRPAELAGALAGHGLRLAEIRTDRDAGVALRGRVAAACAKAIASVADAGGGRR